MFGVHIEQRGCMASANTRISTLGASHVLRPYLVQIGCRSSANKQISSVSAINFWRPYSAQSDCMSSASPRNPSLGARHISSSSSAQICCRSSANTGIFSFSGSQVSVPFRTDRLQVEHKYTLFDSWRVHVEIQNSAEIGCNLRQVHLVSSSQVSRTYSSQISCMPIVYLPIFFSWRKSCLASLFCSDRLLVEV